MEKVGDGECIAANVFVFAKDLIVNLKNTNELSALSLNNLLIRNVIRIAEPRLVRCKIGITF